MSVKINKVDGEANAETAALIKKAKAVNTFYSEGTLYQVPAYTINELQYGTYTVTVTAVYTEFYDLTYYLPQNNLYADDMPKSGDLVDLSEQLGAEYASCEYYCIDDGESLYSDGRLKVSNCESDLVGVRKRPGTDEKELNYNVSVDSVRIYNPAGANLESGTAFNVYQKDGELNPKYINIRNKLEEISGKFYITKHYTKTSDTEIESIETMYDAEWDEYNKTGSAYELVMSNGNAVTFKVTDYTPGDRVHLSLRALGKAVTATVTANSKSKVISVYSATEQFYDISDYVDTDGTGKLSDEKLVEIVRENFDLRPAGIIKMLDLRRPIYKQTAAYGHFGRNEKGQYRMYIDGNYIFEVEASNENLDLQNQITLQSALMDSKEYFLNLLYFIN